MDKKFKRAVEILKKGGIVIFPTDTAFGIGCRMDNKKAVGRLLEIRKRPKSMATPVLVDGTEMAKDYWAFLPKNVLDKLIKPYWPGALTIILYCNKVKVPTLVRSGGDTLGIRMPNHPITLKLIKNIGIPILGPSANFHGDKTPFKFKDLNPKLVKLADYVLPGKTSNLGSTSTVVDCSVSPWKILRQGAVLIDSMI